VKSDIGSESQFLHIPPAFDAPTRGAGRFPSEYCHAVWYGITRTAGLPDSLKKFEDMFIRYDTTHERDRQTHTDAACRHRPSLCIASRGKNGAVILRHVVLAIVTGMYPALFHW